MSLNFQIMDVKLLDVTTWGSLEFGAVGILLGYFVVWIIGHRQNKTIAERVMDEVSVVFKKQFAKVDDVHEDSADVFTLYGTGRSHVESAHATLTLCPRHDFLGRFLINQVMPTPDSLLVEISGIEIQEPLCFCLTRSSLVKYQQDRFSQLATITKTRAVSAFKDKLPLVSLADSSDAADALAGPTSPIGLLSVEAASVVQCVYVSSNKRLIAEFSIHAGLASAVEAVIQTAQAAATLRLSDKGRKEATEARAKDDSKRKAEEEARREKFAERKAEKLKAMSSEQREKLREREEKKNSSLKSRIRKI